MVWLCVVIGSGVGVGVCIDAGGCVLICVYTYFLVSGRMRLGYHCADCWSKTRLRDALLTQLDNQDHRKKVYYC